ncbi:transcription factor DUO1-like [Populus nigra]|uniref:transcription factor DUO1-like n=1 Tax=Populus nigra TaxID=3691 RepID=UPI002B27A990|nr:transcription factor DUO1-like [Populus nigra]
MPSIRKMEGFKKEEIRKGPWKAEEDDVLIMHVKKYGPRDWSSIRSKGLLQRTGKSCRLRWVNKLRPNLKHGCKFSAEEERVVIDLQAEFGNKWARIATYLPGRTDNDVKNFWSSRQKRLARILQTSGTPSSSNSKPQKSKNEFPVFQDVPTSEAPIFSSSMEEESFSKACSSSYLDNPEQIRMMPLPSLVKTDLPNGYANLGQYEPLSTVPFPQIPQPQPGLLFSPESHGLLARLDDPYFLNVLGTADAPELGDAAQFSLGPALFAPVSSCMNSATDVTNHMTPDTLFDEFPSDMFDHIELLPSPSEW